jgi:Ribosomal protein L35Ae
MYPYFGVLQIDIGTRSLYSKGRVLGHKRGKRNSRPNTTLVQVEGVADQKEAQFYLGKVSTGERYNLSILINTPLVASRICLSSKEGDWGLKSTSYLGVSAILLSPPGRYN